MRKIKIENTGEIIELDDSLECILTDNEFCPQYFVEAKPEGDIQWEDHKKKDKFVKFFIERVDVNIVKQEVYLFQCSFITKEKALTMPMKRSEAWTTFDKFNNKVFLFYKFEDKLYFGKRTPWRCLLEDGKLITSTK